MEFLGRADKETQMIQHDQFKSKNCFMKLSRGVPVDTEGFPFSNSFSRESTLTWQLVSQPFYSEPTYVPIVL